MFVSSRIVCMSGESRMALGMRDSLENLLCA